MHARAALANVSPLARRLLTPLAAILLVLCAVALAVSVYVARYSAAGQLEDRADAVARAYGDGDGRAQARQLARALDAEIALSRGGKAPEARPATETFEYPLRSRSGEEALLVMVPSSAVGEATRTALLLTGLALLGLLLGALLATRALVAKHVTTPLRDLRSDLDRAAAADTPKVPRPHGAREMREVFNALGRLVQSISARQAELETRAATDPVTKLPSRQRFHEALAVEIERARRAGGPMTLAKVDVDGLAAIRDELGEPAGEDVLRKVADALRGSLRGTDFLARLGTDHFGLILAGADAEAALLVIERAREEVAACDATARLSASAGYACFPADASDSATLLQEADGALAWANREGGDTSRRYEAERVMLSPTQEQSAELEEMLSLEHPIQTVFQPVVSLASGRIHGYEALARFPQSPERGPLAWFTQAYRCGYGPRLEARAVEAALATSDRPEGTFLSVNLSPEALCSPQVQAVLPDDLSDLVIEITEQEPVVDEAALQEALTEVRRRGGRVAVDDAGAGYAGLRQVMNVHPDLIKLDRSLVEGVDSDLAKAALIDSLVRFARRTGAEVCAEGIERVEELRTLADLDVTYGQGYVLARPARAWPLVAFDVAGPLLRRSLRTGTSLATDTGTEADGDRRLEQVVERLSEIHSLTGLDEGLRLIAAELGGHEAALLRYEGAGDQLEAVSHHAWMKSGERIDLAGYGTSREVLTSREVVQVLFSDGSAEMGELALLGTSGYRALLIAPVVSHGQSLGVLQVFGREERPWSRSDANRARILAYQLGSVVEGLSGREPIAAT